MTLDESTEGMPLTAKQMGVDIYENMHDAINWLLCEAKNKGFKFYKILGFRSKNDLLHKMTAPSLAMAEMMGWNGRYDIYVW